MSKVFVNSDIHGSFSSAFDCDFYIIGTDEFNNWVGDLKTKYIFDNLVAGIFEEPEEYEPDCSLSSICDSSLTKIALN